MQRKKLSGAMRTLAAAGVLLALLGLSNEARAVRAPAEARADAKRFGLDQFRRTARRSPSAKSRRAYERFNHGNGGRWVLRFNGRTGLPAALVDGVSAPRPGPPEAAARSFLGEQRELLGLDPDALVMETSSSGRGQRHVLFRQTYRGLPVEFARVKVHLDARGAVTGVHSNFEPDLNMDIRPGLTEAQAAEAARRDAGAGPSSRGALVIFPDERTGRARLAWKFTVRAKTALWRYYIDARTGEIIFRYNDLRFICGGQTSVVSGMVYDIDPNATPGPKARPFANQNVYLGDGSDAVTTGADGSYCAGPKAMFTQLQGPYVNVSNFRGPSAHYDNGLGSAWYTVATPLSSPHPYPSGATLSSTINIPAQVQGRVPVKALPVFSRFSVGAIASASSSGGEGGNITDDSELAILDALGNPVGAFLGNLGAFNGTAAVLAPGANNKYMLRLKASAAAGGYGYDLSLSSCLVLGDPPGSYDAGYNMTWSSANALGGMHSEISLFYNINRQHDFFTAGSDGSFTPSYAPGVDVAPAVGGTNPSVGGTDPVAAPAIPADINSRPVNVVALVGPDIGDPFYDPDNDNINFGDISDAAMSDALADDATVPRHEYTHYVVSKIWPIQNFGQAGAISEGNADYFSATSLDDSAIGAYVNGGAALRELDCQKSGATCAVLCPVPGAANCTADWSGEIHADSIFFSQALWDLRRDQINRTDLAAGQGQACADGLAFQALLSFPESFEEYFDAIKQADKLGSVAACNGAGSALASITNGFNNHGLPLGGSAEEIYTGFQSALDISTLSFVTGAIYPAGHEDFYTFGAGPGLIRLALTLPPDVNNPGQFKAYQLDLFDVNHNDVATAAPPFNGYGATLDGVCGSDDCDTTRQNVVLSYVAPFPGQFYAEVSGGSDGASNSGVNSLSPYTLTFSYPKAGAVAAGVVSAVYDNDVISFTVAVTTFAASGQTQNYVFDHAQLRDQAQNAVANTRTDVSGGYLASVPGSVSNASGKITGQVGIAPGFADNFPALGTVYIEIFGKNVVTGNMVSLGLSNAINLAAKASGLKAFNNIFNPALGKKATVQYEVQSPGHVVIKIYTRSGTLVGTLFDGNVPAGKGTVDWAGNNMSGARVASGVYIVRVTGPGISQTQKIVVVK